MSDLQRRTEALLQKRGYLTGSVERRKRFPARGKPACRACGAVPMIDISHDLWNVFDLIAVKQRPLGVLSAHVIFVQVTSSSNHADRRNKIIASNEAKLCLLSGAAILIQSWRKKDNRWQAQDEWISLDQFVFGLADTAGQFYEDERRRKMPDLPPGVTLPLSPELKKKPSSNGKFRESWLFQ